MPLYRRSHSTFQRGAVERRSLRWRSSGTNSVKHLPSCKRQASHTPRTSIDLELDLRAQHNRLYALEDDLQRLRELKHRLQQAKEKGDTEVASWVLEDVHFQNLIAQVFYCVIIYWS